MKPKSQKSEITRRWRLRRAGWASVVMGGRGVG